MYVLKITYFSNFIFTCSCFTHKVNYANTNLLSLDLHKLETYSSYYDLTRIVNKKNPSKLHHFVNFTRPSELIYGRKKKLGGDSKVHVYR